MPYKIAQIKRNMMGDNSIDFEGVTRKGLRSDPEFVMPTMK